jgi:predicted DNA-binding transcriptional regulator AlpA
LDKTQHPEVDVDLLRLAEVAELTGVSEATLRFWRHTGTYGPPSAKLGRRVVYRRAEVFAWIDEQFTGATPPEK